MFRHFLALVPFLLSFPALALRGERVASPPLESLRASFTSFLRHCRAGLQRGRKLVPKKVVCSGVLAFLVAFLVLTSHTTWTAEEPVPVAAQPKGSSQESRGLLAQVKSLEDAQVKALENEAAQAIALKALTDEVNTLRAEVTTLRAIAEDAHRRVTGICLSAPEVRDGKEWACGQEDRADAKDLWLMYGFRDGTSCEVKNRAYYKRIELTVPEQKK